MPYGAPSRAFIYTNGTITDIGSLDGGATFAAAITNCGEIVGDSNGRAFLYRHGKMRDLGTLPGRVRTWANAINHRGQIVGNARLGDDTAFLYSNGQMQNLETLGQGSASTATAINDHGEIVGFSQETRNPFIYTGGHIKSITPLPGSDHDNWALDINNSSQVVGWVVSRERIYSAFVFYGNQMYNLNDAVSLAPGVVLEEARAINDGGQIVGVANDNRQTRHAFLLTPLKTASSRK